MEGPRKGGGSGAANSVSNTTNSNTNMDGKSFQMPGGSLYDDEVSSLDTSHLGGNSLEVSMSAVLFTSAPSFDGNDSTSGGDDRDSATSQGDGDAVLPGVRVPPYDPGYRAPSGSGGYGNAEEEEAQRKKKGAADGGVLCIPAWIVNAGPCIKAIIVLSTALLVGSLVLVLVAVLISTQNNSRSSISTRAQGPASSDVTSAPTFLPLPPLTDEPTAAQPFGREAPLPTLSPVAESLETPSMGTPLPTLSPRAQSLDAPTEAPEETVNGAVVTEMPTSTLTNPGPTQTPSDSTLIPPTVASSPPPTVFPTSANTTEPSPSPTTTTFYVTGGRFREDSGLSDLLRSLEGSDGLFLVHLGDYNNPFLTGCDRSSVMNVSDLFSASPIPVFFIPGNNDWIDCFDADTAGDYWREILVNYETKFWKPSSLYTVRRQEKRPENFAFVLRKVIFIGLNLVNGFVRDGDEWNARLEDNAAWMEESVEPVLSEINMIVIYAHSGTEQPTRNAVFFNTFESKAVEWGLPVYVISSTSKEATNLESNGLGLPNVNSLRVVGRTWPPVQVIVDGDTTDFRFNQDDWYDLFVGGT